MKMKYTHSECVQVFARAFRIQLKSNGSRRAFYRFVCGMYEASLYVLRERTPKKVKNPSREFLRRL